MIRSIFLDFDSTTFSHTSKKIPDSAYEAIIKAQTNNVKVFLATGRDIHEIKKFDCRNIRFDGYVLDDGQLLLDKNFNILEVRYIKGKDKEKAINYFKNKTFPIMLTTNNGIYINYLDDNVEKTINDVSSQYPPIKNTIDDKIITITIYIKNHEEKTQIINEFKESNVTWWHDKACDIVPKDAHKMRGILKMLRLFKIDKEDTLTIGDGENDLEMISGLPHSVAMGNAIDSIKKNAEYTTTDIDNDGLKNAFEHYNII